MIINFIKYIFITLLIKYNNINLQYALIFLIINR